MNTHPEPPVIHPPSTAGMERSKAWGCLAANLFVCPGVGSIMAGRRSGWLEVAGAVGGTVWMAVSMARLVMLWIDQMRPPPDWQGLVRSGWGGLALFMAAWLWSMGTSLSVLRAAGRAAKPQLKAPGPSNG